MFFIFLLALTAFSLAGSAAFFSIYGMAKVYTGAAIAIIIMGSSIEAGKLMAVSYLYRYWKKTGIILKSYMFLGILIAMLVTSSGVYGFLTSAYQTDSIPLKEVESKIELLTKEKEDLSARLNKIDEDIVRVGANFVTKRIELQKSYAPERQRIDKRIVEITSEVHNLAEKKIEQQAHTGPIIYIAKALGKETDDAISILTILIMSVFDPLAVALTICVNIALLDRKKEKQIEEDKNLVEELETKKLEIEHALGQMKELATELQADANLSVDDLKSKIADFNKKTELTEEEKQQKKELEAILANSARKLDIVKKIRNNTPP